MDDPVDVQLAGVHLGAHVPRLLLRSAVREELLALPIQFRFHHRLTATMNQTGIVLKWPLSSDNAVFVGSPHQVTSC